MFWRGEMTLSFLQCFQLVATDAGCRRNSVWMLWLVQRIPEFYTRLQTELSLVPFICTSSMTSVHPAHRSFSSHAL
jgi:hypothetical protein